MTCGGTQAFVVRRPLARTIRTSKPLTLPKRYRRLLALLGQINKAETESWGRQHAYAIQKWETAEWNGRISFDYLVQNVPCFTCAERRNITNADASLQGSRGHWMVSWKWCELYGMAFTDTSQSSGTELNTYGWYWTNVLDSPLYHHHSNTKWGNIF